MLRMGFLWRSNANLTTSVRFGYFGRIPVDSPVEEYYTQYQRGKCLMRADTYIKQENR